MLVPRELGYSFTECYDFSDEGNAISGLNQQNMMKERVEWNC